MSDTSVNRETENRCREILVRFERSKVVSKFFRGEETLPETFAEVCLARFQGLNCGIPRYRCLGRKYDDETLRELLEKCFSYLLNRVPQVTLTILLVQRFPSSRVEMCGSLS